MDLVLASASPARLGVLRAAGLCPTVVVSDVDEDALLGELAHAAPPRRVTALAEAKADSVVDRIRREGADDGPTDRVVIGCDSMLWLDGELVGKPGTAETARRRWAGMAGRVGELITGHAVRRLAAGRVTAAACGHAVTRVRFSEPDEAEMDAYLASGEPLAVAGGFTLDGLGGWFVEGIDGDPSNVIGISLPLTRRLLSQVGVGLPSLWGPMAGRRVPE